MPRALAGALAWLAMALLIAIAAATTLLPGLARHYYLLLPGAAFPVAGAFEVPAERAQPVGDLHFTVVYEAEAGLTDALLAAARPGVRVVPYESIVPSGVTVDESNRISRRLMDESQAAAAAVALRRIGLDVKVTGDGARVVAIVPGTPAEKELRVRDLIVGQNGRPIGTANELIEATRRLMPGDVVDLTIRRDEQEIVISVKTIPAPTEPSRPIVGVMIETDGFRADLPFPIHFVESDVVGPSAGLMFALGIYDALTPERLGGGRRIAGTGTIGIDGQVGPIEGVAQKVLGAEAAGAEIFLAPLDNAEDARRAASRVRVIPVGSFEDALRAVRGLAPSSAG